MDFGFRGSPEWCPSPARPREARLPSGDEEEPDLLRVADPPASGLALQGLPLCSSAQLEGGRE